jgi:hypothetical protein
MSLQIKSLGAGAPVLDNSLSAPNDNFNVIPTPNAVYILYTAANETNNRKTTIVKGIRLVNSHASATVKVSLYFNRPNSVGQNRRRLVAPPDLTLAPGGVFVDDGEITLEPGDQIQAKADVGNALHYIISGVERDMV